MVYGHNHCFDKINHNSFTSNILEVLVSQNDGCLVLPLLPVAMIVESFGSTEPVDFVSELGKQWGIKRKNLLFSKLWRKKPILNSTKDQRCING